MDGYLYRSDADADRDETVCEIVSRATPIDEGLGLEPVFTVRFNDGEMRDVLSQSLTPWFPV